MGLIRKTTSIATLGIVPFRSRKELLRKAEAAHQAAVADLEREHKLREAADQRVSHAEKRRVAAELEALAAAKKTAKAKDARDKAKRKRRHRGPSTTEQVKTEAGKLGRRAKAEARRAAHAAEVEARKAAKATKAKVEEVRATAEPYAERGIERARELGQEAVEVAGTTLTEVRDKARDKTKRGRRHRR